MELLIKMLILFISSIVLLSFLKEHNSNKENYTNLLKNAKSTYYKHKRKIRHGIKNRQLRRSDQIHSTYNSQPLHQQLLGMVGL